MEIEQRLIDANKIKYRTIGAGGWSQPENVVSDYEIEKMPTVDAVPVVRCKDCKHRIYVDMGDEIGAVGGCELFGVAMHYGCFCSYGERKNNG